MLHCIYNGYTTGKQIRWILRLCRLCSCFISISYSDSYTTTEFSSKRKIRWSSASVLFWRSIIIWQNRAFHFRTERCVEHYYTRFIIMVQHKNVYTWTSIMLFLNEFLFFFKLKTEWMEHVYLFMFSISLVEFFNFFWVIVFFLKDTQLLNTFLWTNSYSTWICRSEKVFIFQILQLQRLKFSFFMFCLYIHSQDRMIHNSPPKTIRKMLSLLMYRMSCNYLRHIIKLHRVYVWYDIMCTV